MELDNSLGQRFEIWRFKGNSRCLPHFSISSLTSSLHSLSQALFATSRGLLAAMRICRGRQGAFIGTWLSTYIPCLLDYWTGCSDKHRLNHSLILTVIFCGPSRRIDSPDGIGDHLAPVPGTTRNEMKWANRNDRFTSWRSGQYEQAKEVLST